MNNRSIKEQMMNVARKITLIAVGYFACIGAEAQGVDCTTSTKLACIVPYRTNAIFTPGGTATTQASIFSGPLGTQLSQLPLAAAAPGAVILTLGGTPQAYPNLGPILIDRPDSVGRSRFVLGFSAQEFNFNHLDGIGIGNIPFVYQIPQGTGTGYYSQTIHTAVKYNQYVLVAAYGLPRKTDFSVVVPITRISIGVASLNPMTYTLNSATGKWSGVTAATGNLYTRGSASGIGDVVLNLKHVLWGGGDSRGAAAAGVALRLPTGDALNYLGSGAAGFNLYGLAAYKAKFSPHVKIAYQWNAKSILLNIGGNSSNDSKLPGGLQTAIGADFGATRFLTISGDVITNEFQNSPSISAGSVTLTDTNGQQSVAPLPTVNNVTKSFTTANLSFGVKLKPLKKNDLVLYGNLLTQMNDVGLRSDPSPSVGISYNFHGPEKWPKWLNRSPGHW